MRLLVELALPGEKLSEFFFDGWSDQSVEILPKLLRASWASVESGIHLVAFFDIANGYKNWSLWFVVFTMGDLR